MRYVKFIIFLVNMSVQLKKYLICLPSKNKDERKIAGYIEKMRWKNLIR